MILAQIRHPWPPGVFQGEPAQQGGQLRPVLGIELILEQQEVESPRSIHEAYPAAGETGPWTESQWLRGHSRAEAAPIVAEHEAIGRGSGCPTQGVQDERGQAASPEPRGRRADEDRRGQQRVEPTPPESVAARGSRPKVDARCGCAR